MISPATFSLRLIVLTLTLTSPSRPPPSTLHPPRLIPHLTHPTPSTPDLIPLTLHPTPHTPHPTPHTRRDFLDLIRKFVDIEAEKRASLEDHLTHIRTGLHKLLETQDQVADLRGEMVMKDEVLRAKDGEGGYE